MEQEVKDLKNQVSQLQDELARARERIEQLHNWWHYAEEERDAARAMLKSIKTVIGGIVIPE